MSKYGVFSVPYFPVFGLKTEIYEVFSPNTGKYGPEKTLYLGTFHAMSHHTTGYENITLIVYCNMIPDCTIAIGNKDRIL